MTQHLALSPITMRDELHEFIDEIEDELTRPVLHATIDTLPEELIQVVLDRMRALRAHTTVLPPQMD